MSTEPEIRSLADALRAERGLILVVTGAGVSLASGIPTFRGNDPGALWKRDITEMATLDYFRRDPLGSWTWYDQRFATLAGARPNPAHFGLAALERWQVGRGGEFLLVAQNIDGLHEEAGSSRLVKVHGSANRVRCSRDGCRLGAPSGSLLRSDVNLSAFERSPGQETLPRCRECKSFLRQHVLWFDEYYASHDDYQWQRVTEALRAMRLVLCMGTSLSVGVTDAVVKTARRGGVPLYIVEPNSPAGVTYPDVTYLRFKAEELMPAVCRELEIPPG